jgi:hypothetical protein
VNLITGETSIVEASKILEIHRSELIAIALEEALGKKIKDATIEELSELLDIDTASLINKRLEKKKQKKKRNADINLKQLCKEKNINYRTFSARYNVLGWSLEDALNTPALELGGGRAGKGKKHTYLGETNDLRYFSEKYNISLNVLYARIKSGFSIEEAINKPVRITKRTKRDVKNG